MLESDSFREIEEFVRSKQDVKTELAISYTFDCMEMSQPKFTTKIFALIYFLVFALVGTYTIVKY